MIALRSHVQMVVHVWMALETTLVSVWMVSKANNAKSILMNALRVSIQKQEEIFFANDLWLIN